VGSVAVPTFFLISGFWLVKDYDGTFNWWKISVAKRLLTIVFPMCLWAAIGYAYEYLSYGTCVPCGLANGYLPQSMMQFWFYRTLFAYVLISPLFCVLVKRFWIGLFVVLLLWLFAFCGVPGQHQYFMWINEAAFVCGIWISLNRQEFDRRVGTFWPRVKNWTPVLFVILLILLSVLSVTHHRVLANRVRYISIPVGCATLWWGSPWLVRVLEPIRAVYSLNIFVFAIHFIVLWRMAQLLEAWRLTPRTVPFIIAQYLGTLVICLSLGLLLKRFAPRLLKFLSGNRT